MRLAPTFERVWLLGWQAAILWKEENGMKGKLFGFYV